MSTIWRDAKYGVRTMAKSPSFTVVAVLTLGLAIGATTAMFSVVNSVLLSPLPFRNPEELVRLYTQFPSMGFDKFWISRPEYFELRRDAKSYAELAAWSTDTNAIGGIDRPVRVPIARATASLGPLLGVKPLLGRWYGADDEIPTSTEDRVTAEPRVIVLSYNLWRRAFGGSPKVIGKKITADAVSVEVIGVMPKGFDFPGEGVEAWLPAGLHPQSFQRGNHFLSVIGRLRPGVGIETAGAEVSTLVTTWGRLRAPLFHTINPDFHPMKVYSLKAEIVGSVKWALWLLQGAVLFVLLIACANVSNLLLARAEVRVKEIAIRAALGAGRGRLIRQFLTESAMLGLLGGGVGLVFAVWGVDFAVGLLPAEAPRAGEIHIDAVVLVFCVGCAFATSLLFGLGPIFHMRVTNLHERLKESGQRTSQPRQRFRRALVIVEVALAVVLVIGCGLMIKSFARVQRVNVGFKPDGLLTMQLDLPRRAYPEDKQINAFWDRLLVDLRAIPGVASASIMSGLPPFRSVNANDMYFEGKTFKRDVDRIPNSDFWNIVDDQYFATMSIALKQGRLFGPADGPDAPPVVIINEALARRFYPEENPIGKRVRTAAWLRGAPLQTIVGVVADVKQQGVDAPTGTEVYIPYRQSKVIIDGAENQMNLLLRAADGVSPASLAPHALAAVRRADESLPVAMVRTMDQVLWSTVAKPRFLTFLMSVFAGLALVLAAVGIYGVMSYTVEQRTRELGIRVALGAHPARLRRLVLAQGLVLNGIGVAAGLAGALGLNAALAHVFSQVLFQTTALDPFTFVVVAGTVVLVAALACWIPALRATRVDPMIALRAD